MDLLTVLSPYLIHLGALCYLVCFLFRDQLKLRIFAVLGDIIYTGFYFVAADQPLWSAIVYSTLNIIINFVMMSMILNDRRQTTLGDNDLRLYQSFPGMTPGDFRRLTRMGKWHRADASEILTEEGKPPERLYYVLEGSMELRKGDRNSILPAGIFIGEIAYLKNTPASATVVAKPGTQFMAWNQSDLKKFTERHDSLKQSLNLLLSTDLAAKVARA
jgi:CRP-like cAMP-binding protein